VARLRSWVPFCSSAPAGYFLLARCANGSLQLQHEDRSRTKDKRSQNHDSPVQVVGAGNLSNQKKQILADEESETSFNMFKAQGLGVFRSAAMSVITRVFDAISKPVSTGLSRRQVRCRVIDSLL
jgi:hypothetical protein